MPKNKSCETANFTGSGYETSVPGNQLDQKPEPDSPASEDMDIIWIL